MGKAKASRNTQSQSKDGYDRISKILIEKFELAKEDYKNKVGGDEENTEKMNGDMKN